MTLGRPGRIAAGILTLLVVGVLVNSAVFSWRFLRVPRFQQAAVLDSWHESGASATFELDSSTAMEFAAAPADPSSGHGLWIGRHEVTVAQYGVFVASTHYATVAEREGFGWMPRDGGFVRVPGVSWKSMPNDGAPKDQPPTTAVSLLAWVDANAFAVWASARSRRAVRLPTSAEWEAVCAAGGGAPDPGDLDRRAWHRGNTGGPRPVGELAPDALGIYDLLGNVWEWNSDLPRWWVLNERALSGGSWMNGGASMRCDNHATEDVRIREPHIGFRVAVEMGGR